MDINAISTPLIIGVVIYLITCLGLYLVARKSTEDDFAVFAFVPIMNIYLLVRLSGHDMGMLLLLLSSPLLMVYSPILILITVVLYCYIIILIGARTGASFLYTFISIPLPTVGFFLMWDSIKDNRNEETDIRYERIATCPNCKALCGTDKIKTNTIKCRECGERVTFKPAAKGIDQNIRIMTENKQPIELDIREEERNEQEERLIKEYKENFEKKY